MADGISCSLAAKSYTMFTGCKKILVVCVLVLGRQHAEEKMLPITAETTF